MNTYCARKSRKPNASSQIPKILSRRYATSCPFLPVSISPPCLNALLPCVHPSIKTSVRSISTDIHGKNSTESLYYKIKGPKHSIVLGPFYLKAYIDQRLPTLQVRRNLKKITSEYDLRIQALNGVYATEKYPLSEPAQNHKNRKNLRSRIAHRLKRERTGKIKTEPGTRIARRGFQLGLCYGKIFAIRAGAKP